MHRLIDNWKNLLVGSVKGSRFFGLSSSLLLPSSVNSSTLCELGAREHPRDETEAGGERERWVGELD